MNSIGKKKIILKNVSLRWSFIMLLHQADKTNRTTSVLLWNERRGFRLFRNKKFYYLEIQIK